MDFQLYRELLWAWIAVGVITFFILLKVPAPYGRHTTAAWGPMIDNRLAWFIMEFVVLVALYFFVLKNLKVISCISWIMIALFTFHYIRRSIIYPLTLKTQGKKMPVLIMFSAITFNMVNGSALGYYFTHYTNYADDWWNDPRFISGIILFFGGTIINYRADEILTHLRKPGETSYKIPHGNLFEYISCPNHFGEIMEWFGFALLCWNLPAFAFFIWTCANLIPRSLAHHKWYREKFSDYPKERKAIFPFLL